MARKITDLVGAFTAATTALIAYTSFALIAVLRHNPLTSLAEYTQAGVLILTTSTATLLVMSMLYGETRELYRKLGIKEQDAYREARTDVMTGLGNRKFLIEQLDTTLAQQESGGIVALLLLDLDQFKRVNDTLGHVAGDELIVQLSARLRRFAPDSILARLGGDEFALIVERASIEELTASCCELASRLEGGYDIAGLEANVGVSIGVSLLGVQGTVSDHLRRADMAMYKAKSARTGYKIFDSEMNAGAEHRARLQQRLRSTIKTKDGLSALFQPQVDRTNRIVGLEALLRWDDKELGPILPQDAISIAEESCLVNELGLFMAERSAEAARSFPDAKICLNVASLQLLNPRFSDRLAVFMLEHGVEPRQFRIEVPARALDDSSTDLAPVLARLRSLGFGLTADNYGLNTSSLSYIRDLGIESVKLDRSLVETARECRSISVLRATVTLAGSLGLEVVCGGVADDEARAIALQAGCETLQGFFYSEPLPLWQIAQLAPPRLQKAV